MKHFYDSLSHILDELVMREYDVRLEHPLWEVPKQQEFGDLSAMVALRLASKLKKDPFEIAGTLKNALAEKLGDDVERIEILKPGFINIFLSRRVLIDSLNEILSEGDAFFRTARPKKVLIEFLSANPTGPLSIAHGRQAVIGDTIANILAFCGNHVTREYYLNDAGRQIELFAQSVNARLQQLKGADAVLPEGGYQGEYVKDIAQAYLDEDARGEIGEFGLSRMIAAIKKDLHDLGIREFDAWFSQKGILDNGAVTDAIEALQKKGLIYEKEDAVWFSSTTFGDDKDRVIKKADGELTYFASDIAYHKNKAERGYDTLVNLWGPDHHGYIKRVKTSLEAFGFSQELLNVIIIQLVTLKTKERMSKRAGTFVKLAELVADVGKDATRFYYLTRKNSSILEFDIDLAKQASFENPLYYIQYVCARIESIFRKAGSPALDMSSTAFLESPEELSLVRTLLQFSYCLEKAYYSLEPVFIIEFLKNLAQSFHKFYENVRILDAGPQSTPARLTLIRAVRTVFHCGLNLLGITPSEKM